MSSSSYPSAREAILLSTTSTTSYPSSLLLIDLALPSLASPLLTFKLQQPHSIGKNKLAFAPTTFSPTGLTSGDSAGLVHVQGNDGDAGAGYVITQADNTSVLTAHNFQTPQLQAKIILPQRLSCLAVSPSTHLLAEGLPDGRICLHDVKTGEMVAAPFDAHYRAVSCLLWSAGGDALVSGGEDGRICVWSLAGLLDPSQCYSSTTFQHGGTTSSSSTQPIPYAIFSDHTLSVTSLHLHPSSSSSSSSSAGPSAFPSQMTLWSASQDGTVKHWSLRTRTLLSTFSFPAPVAEMCVDDFARFLLVATASSSSPVAARSGAAAASSSTTPAAGSLPGSNTLYRIDMFKRVKRSTANLGPQKSSSSKGTKVKFIQQQQNQQQQQSSISFEPRGGHAPSEVERIGAGLGDETTSPAASEEGISRLRFSEPITSLALSLTSSIALVGTSTARIHFIDVSSFQVLRSISLLSSLSSASGGGPTSSTSSSGKLPSISNIRCLLTPPDLLCTLTSSDSSSFSAIGATGTTGGALTSSAVSPLQQSLDSTLRRSGRIKARFAPPLLATKLDRTTRNTAALAQSHPQQGTADVSSEAKGGAQNGATAAPASALDRFTRVAGRTDPWKSEPDALVSYISAGFFDGLLDPLPPAAKLLPPPTSNLGANGQFVVGATASDDMISFEEVGKAHAVGNAKGHKRKGVGEDANGSISPLGSHLRAASGEADLRAENEELRRLLHRAKSVNDQMWNKLVEAGVLSAEEATLVSR